MNWANYDDVLEQLRSAGLLVDALEVGSHKPKRCKIEGDREERGWYWLSEIQLDNGAGERESYVVGSFGIWRGNDNGSTKVALPSRKGARPALSADERKAIQARHRENAKRAAAIRAAEAERAAARAANAWRHYLPTGASDYLERKGVGAHGVRFASSGNGTLAVPMCDAAGRVWGLQIIRGKDRGTKLEKQYWPKGLAKQGRYHLIGAAQPGGVVLLAEGYATAATLHEATQLPVAVAFDAGNLLPVAEVIKKTYKGVRILVCADDDYLTLNNPGVTAANAAALAVSGAVCVPAFPGDRAGKKLTDFNDLAAWPAGGLHLVRTQVEEAIRAAGWKVVGRSVRADPITEGSGDGRPAAVSVLSLDESVERFLPIDDGTGMALYDSWTHRLVRRDQMVALLPAGIRWDDVKRHPQWQARGSYYLDQLGFDPAGEDPNVLLNLWTGWPCEPKQGRCDRLLELLEWQCSGEANRDELYDWVLRWLAYPLQHPGAKMHSALVVHGPQGTGKSRFFEAVARIYGDYAVVLNQGAIEDKFNADWVSRKLFIIADEIVAKQEMFHLKNHLKALITGEWVRVNPKNLPAYRERNHANLVFLSNEHMPLVLEQDDRRHAVIWTPDKLGRDFYDEVSAEIDAGGVAALHQYLLDLDLGDFRPWTPPPMSDAKRQLIDVGRDSVLSFLDEWAEGEVGVPCCPCRSSALYKTYLGWCRAVGERFPRSEKQFASVIDKLTGWVRGHKSVYESIHYQGRAKRARLVIPAPAHLDRAVRAGWMGNFDPRYRPDRTETQWLTDCVLTFDGAQAEDYP